MFISEISILATVSDNSVRYQAIQKWSNCGTQHKKVESESKKKTNIKHSTLPTGEVGQKYYALKKSSPFVNSR